MSEIEGFLIYGSLCLMMILPVAAAGGVYVRGRQNKNKYQRIIEMDGAQCLQAKDGSLTITSKVWQNIFLLGFFVATLGMCGFVAGDNLRRGAGSFIEQIGMVGLWAIFTVPAIIYLLRYLWRPAFYFNLERQVVEIRRGLAKRQIPFGQMVKLSLENWQKDIGWLAGLAQQIYRPEPLPGVRIRLDLENGEAVELGTLSSVKGSEDLQERCRTICQLVAGATGASLPPDLLPESL